MNIYSRYMEVRKLIHFVHVYLLLSANYYLWISLKTGLCLNHENINYMIHIMIESLYRLHEVQYHIYMYVRMYVYAWLCLQANSERSIFDHLSVKCYQLRSHAAAESVLSRICCGQFWIHELVHGIHVHVM